MTGSSISRPHQSPVISELGGPLGRIAAVPGDDRETALPSIRLRLATRLFDAAGTARAAVAAGDRVGAVAALAPGVWQDAWEAAVGAAGEALAATVEADMRAAAAEACMPQRLLDRRLLTAAERRALTARLGRGTGRMAAPLHTLGAAGRAWIEAPPADEMRCFAVWDDAIQAAARRSEAAWLALRDARHEEASRWRAEVARIAAWRRPRWPLWLVTGAVLGLACYLGLVTGGYLPAPAALRPLVDLWWGGP